MCRFDFQPRVSRITDVKLFFGRRGGFMEKPNFAHMPEHSCRLDGGRTTAIFKPIIIGIE